MGREQDPRKKVERLERISTQVLAGILAYHNPDDPNTLHHNEQNRKQIVARALMYSAELIDQIDDIVLPGDPA